MTLLQPAGQSVNGKRNRCLSFLPRSEHESWRKNIFLLTSMLRLYCEITSLVFLFPSVLIQGYKTQRSGSLFTEAISASFPDFQGKTQHYIQQILRQNSEPDSAEKHSWCGQEYLHKEGGGLNCRGNPSSIVSKDCTKLNL